jgi:hypothetical protein
VDEKALRNLRGVVRTSFTQLNGHSYQNLAKLNRIPRNDLQQVGWSKATELVKIARKEGDKFDCATWLHRAKEMPKEGFRCAVERHLTAKETEPWELI